MGHFKHPTPLKIPPTGPPGRWAPGCVTDRLCLGIPFFVGLWGSLGYLPRGPVGKIIEHLFPHHKKLGWTKDAVWKTCSRRLPHFEAVGTKDIFCGKLSRLEEVNLKKTSQISVRNVSTFWNLTKEKMQKNESEDIFVQSVFFCFAYIPFTDHIH